MVFALQRSPESTTVVRGRGGGWQRSTRSSHPPRFHHTKTQVELAPIQALLPDELLHHVFLKLPIMDVARTQCVCKHWRQLGEHAELWQQACLSTFTGTPMTRNTELVRTQYWYGNAR